MLRDLVNNYQYPHIGGINAAESFFLDDNVIVTEGQDDVVGFTNVFKYLGYKPKASFYGWGAGGYTNVGIIVKLLYDLGYKKVFVICDKGTKKEIENIMKTYTNYKFIFIPTDDIRNKKDANRDIDKICKKIMNVDFIDDQQKSKLMEIINKDKKKTFLLEDVNNGTIVEEHRTFVNELIQEIKEYFGDINDKIEESEEDKKKLRINRAKTLVNRIIDDNPVSIFLREKFKGEDYGDTAGDVECYCIGF